ncbi:MAG: AAA family ATPase, partial [Nocardioides sp.]
MTEVFEPVSEHDWRLVAGASGLLADFNRAGVLESTDVHVATRLGDLAGEDDPTVHLAVALAVRAVRHGSVGVDLATVPSIAPDLPWPEADAWAAAVAGSAVLTDGAVRLDHGLLYLDRYHRLEGQVCDDLVERAAQPPPPVDEAALAVALGRVRDEHLSAEQEDAVVRAVRQWTTVLTGGPGTGKTTTVARLLALVADQAD